MRGRAAAVFVIAVIGLFIGLLPGLRSNIDSPGSGASTSTPPATSAYEPPPYIPPVNTYVDPPTTTTTTPDLFQQAQVGSCFVNDAGYAQPDLTTADCGNANAFRVVQILTGTTDPSGCDIAPDDYNVPDVFDDMVLCLSYKYANTVYHATVGECVIGANQSNVPWSVQPCRTGNFTVKAHLDGSTGATPCSSYPNSDENYTVRTPWTQLDVLLCLSMNYPDAAGRAPINSCLLRTGSGSEIRYLAVACDEANFVVTGRTGAFDDPAFCGQNASTWWEPNGFPGFAYTVCLRRI